MKKGTFQMASDQIAPQVLWEWLDNQRSLFLLDVRTPEEYKAGHLAGGYLIPIAELERRVSEIPRDKPIVVYCRSGGRSQRALEYLKSIGYTEVYNLIGGVLACDQDRIL